MFNKMKRKITSIVLLENKKVAFWEYDKKMDTRMTASNDENKTKVPPTGRNCTTNRTPISEATARIQFYLENNHP